MGGTGPNRSQTDCVLSSMRSWQTWAFALVTRSFLTKMMTLVFDFPFGTRGWKVV
jgi:hypothetical protein